MKHTLLEKVLVDSALDHIFLSPEHERRAKDAVKNYYKEKKKRMEILDNKQLIEVLKKRRGKLPVTQFSKQLKVVSTQFLAKVLTGEYYIGPKIAKALGYEQVVRFVKIPAKRPAKKAKAKPAAAKPAAKAAAAK